MDNDYKNLLTQYIFKCKESDIKDILLAQVLAGLYPVQRNVILSKALKKSILTPRQVGKTHTLIRYLIYSALKNKAPGAITAYLTDTREHAKGLVWIPLLQLLEDLKIPHETNTQELLITLKDNNSRIRLFGADNERTASRLRGYQYNLFVIDETQNLPDELLTILLDEVVDAALQAHKAPLVLVGTPGPVLQGYFYEVTENPLEHGYEYFSWTQYDNPLFPRWSGLDNWKDKVSEFLEEKALEYGGKDNPAYQREYLGRWTRDNDLLCYHLSDKNNIDNIPSGLKTVMSIDLGWHDKTAWVILGYSQVLGKSYVIETYQAQGQIFDEIMDITKSFIEKYQASEVHHSLERIRVDSAGAGKIIQESLARELTKRYQIPVLPADKRDKAVFMKLMDNDLRAGRLLLNHNDNKDLWEQLSTIIKNPIKQIEREGQPCDLADALLYSYRDAYQYISKPAPEVKPAPGTPEYYQKLEDEMFNQALEQSRIEEEQEGLLGLL